ncbi:MAG: hypothetical protein GX319_05220 [Clostridiales bacterium]|jgi:hypothetical protein|nr:hypothetical protein [Bacillota bacterium]NLK03794.1 hypothetical protein [Clostridiales bacterium]
MLGIIYLMLCLCLGWAISNFVFPDLDEFTSTTYDNRPIHLSPYLLLIPVWFIIGVLSMTWPVYLIALLASSLEAPLLLANTIVMNLAAIFVVASICNRYHKKKLFNKLLSKDSGSKDIEWTLLFFVWLLATILMWSTFYIKDGQLNIGVSVFSDFSPHVGMIRSFSYGNNFPTSYSHFAGEDIKYHFMFQFLAGNLEFLGMRIDYAFNIPSILSLMSAFMLLYVLTVKITGRILSGVLALLFFAFRSGKALFLYISKIPKGESIIASLWNNTSFIGETTHEDWGLWNLNVYCNQRHLAFGLAAMFFLIIMFLPHFYEMAQTLKDNKPSFKKIFLSKEGWEIKSIRYPVSLGILLGSMSFFHGSAVIACLLVLFVIAIFSKRRLEFLITALLTVALTFLQSRLFISGSIVSAKFFFGFIAENKTIFGVISYLERLLGILPLCIVLAFIFGGLVERYLIIASLAPLVFAFTVSLTVDVTVNHKYIMMSCILIGVFVAGFITRILDRKKLIFKISGGLLILMLTITGIYDFTTVLRKNSREGKIILNMEDPLTEFIRTNCDAKDIFLTDSYTINQVVLGGAMLYQGHQYYAWSAGYDTGFRDIMVARMYEAKTPRELHDLVMKNKIRYIIVDYGNRVSMDYDLNEENIRATYKCVYETGQGEWDISIFDTKKMLYNE